MVSELQPAEEVLRTVELNENASSGVSEVIDEMSSRVDTDVPEATKLELRRLMHEYPTVFSTGETDIGATDLVMHRIDTGDARPARQ